ncbi:serine--tRNA ligase [Cohnella endophytica]|uniref:Serine--tRNA ligase n=1 Tax=Cohnella endophytica TaxID=2419778 RepID=A0A494XX81_9BACL|nr:serine--tRNA ligase [Cohnella endophytica]RKP55102.1 serine--tRNA ligase [Cohnella endophytica]
MLDIKWIRQNGERVQTVADQKGIELSVKELLDCDESRRKLLNEAEQHRESRNKTSQQIGRLVSRGDFMRVAALKAEVAQVNVELAMIEKELTAAEERYASLMQLVPNDVSPDTPIGRSDEDNVEIRRVGVPIAADFEMLDHIALGNMHGMIDIPRGVKTAGTRNYYLSGDGVLLHRAVQQLALDLLLASGFTLLDVPLMVRPDAMRHTGFFPLGEDQIYKVAEENKVMIGTSEVPLVAYYSNEVVDVTDPLRLAAASVCFRSEVGSTGKDVQGLYRVHQFAKVEQVIVCEADAELSDRLLGEITGNAEELLRLLELPYRVMAVCTGDMSQKTYKQYDIETWMPSRQAYGETHSSSNLHDFQARRANIRYRDTEGNLRYCHTLNNTAVASPRILIPLLENHQAADGSIYVPVALRPYLGGRERLYPKAEQE